MILDCRTAVNSFERLKMESWIWDISRRANEGWSRKLSILSVPTQQDGSLQAKKGT
jgi:hypothetical protein